VANRGGLNLCEGWQSPVVGGGTKKTRTIYLQSVGERKINIAGGLKQLGGTFLVSIQGLIRGGKGTNWISYNK